MTELHAHLSKLKIIKVKKRLRQILDSSSISHLWSTIVPLLVASSGSLNSEVLTASASTRAEPFEVRLVKEEDGSAVPSSVA